MIGIPHIGSSRVQLGFVQIVRESGGVSTWGAVCACSRTPAALTLSPFGNFCVHPVETLLSGHFLT